MDTKQSTTIFSKPRLPSKIAADSEASFRNILKPTQYSSTFSNLHIQFEQLFYKPASTVKKQLRIGTKLISKEKITNY